MGLGLGLAIHVVTAYHGVSREEGLGLGFGFGFGLAAHHGIAREEWLGLGSGSGLELGFGFGLAAYHGVTREEGLGFGLGVGFGLAAYHGVVRDERRLPRQALVRPGAQGMGTLSLLWWPCQKRDGHPQPTVVALAQWDGDPQPTVVALALKGLAHPAYQRPDAKGWEPSASRGGSKGMGTHSLLWWLCPVRHSKALTQKGWGTLSLPWRLAQKEWAHSAYRSPGAKGVGTLSCLPWPRRRRI